MPRVGPTSAKYRKVKRKTPRKPRLRLSRRTGMILLGAVFVFLVVGVGGTAYSVNLENHDAFCASCHTQPESTYFQQSQNQTPETLASFHTGKSTRCIDCHSGSGSLGRVEGLMQGGQDLISFVSGRYHNPAITTNPISDDTCLKCHDQVAATQDFNNHFHVFLTRWQSVDPNAARCVTCHTSHQKNPSDQAFLNAPAVDTICQQCHAKIREGG